MPTVILAKTVKGKGVSFMENDAGWHGKAPNDEQYKQAHEELSDGVRIAAEEMAAEAMDDAVATLEKLDQAYENLYGKDETEEWI